MVPAWWHCLGSLWGGAALMEEIHSLCFTFVLEHLLSPVPVLVPATMPPALLWALPLEMEAATQLFLL